MVTAPEGRGEPAHNEEVWKDMDKIKAKTLVMWGRENRVQSWDNAVHVERDPQR